MLKTFLFDMGNVLVHFSHDLMCANIGALCDRSGADVRRLLLDSGLQWEFERGKVSDFEFHARFQDCVSRDIEFDALLAAGSDIFQLNASILPVLDALRSRGHRLVLLSNTSSAHFDWVSRHYTVLQRFDDFVVSYRVGALKPEPAIFAAAIQAIQCDPGECFYTDDIPAYIDAGRQHGLQAEIFTETSNLIRQLAARGITLNGRDAPAALTRSNGREMGTGCSEYAESA